MPNLTPASSFDSVPELETTTLALGGPGGPMNLPLQALLNRTQWLHDNAAAGSSSPHATAAGTANAITATYTPAIAAVVNGLKLRFTAATANTGAATFAPDAIAAAAILGQAGLALQGGELAANSEVELTWSSAAVAWVMTACTDGALQVTDGTASHHAISKAQLDALAAASASYADLASTAAGKGASLVTFAPPGANGVPLSVQSRMAKILSNLDYSTLADSQTQAAASGQCIYFPAGTHNVAASITLSSDIRLDPGAIIKPAAGAAITITGAVHAGDWQIFDLSAGGTVSIAGRGVAMRTAWWGMKPGATAVVNTAAFTGALAACPVSDGAELLFPAGKLDVNALSITKSGVSAVGHEKGTWLINNTTNAPAIEQNGTSWGAIRRLRIGQASSVSAVAGNCGLRLLNTDETFVEDVHVFNFPAACYYGMVFDNANNFHFGSLQAFNCGNHGFYFKNGSDGAATDMFSFSNGVAGFQFEGVSGLLGSNFHAYGNVNGFVFPAGFTNQFVYGSNWFADTSDSYNWQIQNLNRSSFSNAWAATQKSSAANTFAVGIFISSSSVFDVQFSGGHAVNNNSHGVQITAGATNVRFTNFLSGGTQPNGKSGSGSGFRIDVVTNVGLSNCRAYGNPSNGCGLSTGASDYLVIVGNDFSGNTGAGLGNSSTGTHNQVVNNAT